MNKIFIWAGSVFFAILFMIIVADRLLRETVKNDPSIPTAAEMYRLDNDLIRYCPSDAIRILQRSLVGEGYQIQVDGVMGQ